MNAFNLTQHISTPTHTSGNTIDFLITPSITKIHNLSTFNFDYSDHYIINFKYFLNCNFNNTTVKVLKRNWKIFNKESFLDLFKYFDFGGFNDVDELLSYFNNFIRYCCFGYYFTFEIIFFSVIIKTFSLVWHGLYFS